MTGLTTILLVLALLFGGAGVVASAAQDALPNDLLYPVKILSEDVRVQLAGDAETRVALSLEFANRRVGEIGSLTARGNPVPAEVVQRLETEVETALTAAVEIEATSQARALEIIRAMLAQQLQVVSQVQDRVPESAMPAITHTQELLAKRLALIEMAINDPHTLREWTREWIPEWKTTPLRPTDLPKPTIVLPTVTIPPRPTDLPKPTIVLPTVTRPPHPTDWVRPTLPAPPGLTPPAPTPNWTPPAPPGFTPPVPTPNWTPPAPPGLTPPVPTPNRTQGPPR